MNEEVRRKLYDLSERVNTASDSLAILAQDLLKLRRTLVTEEPNLAVLDEVKIEGEDA